MARSLKKLLAGLLFALVAVSPAFAQFGPQPAPGVQQVGTPVSGHCPQYASASPQGQITDSGATCGSGAAINPTTVTLGPAPTFAGTRGLGDSLTFGYIPVLAIQLATTVQNDGVPGQTPFQIAARDGGVPTFLTPTGTTICDGGGDVVTTDYFVPLTSNGPSGGVTGTVNGHHGTLTLSGATYTFTCDTTGTAPFLAAEQFVVDQIHRNYLTKLVWIGHNVSQQPLSTIRDMADAILANTPNQTQLAFLSNTYDTGSVQDLSPSGTVYVSTTQNNAYILNRVGCSRYIDTLNGSTVANGCKGGSTGLLGAYTSSFPPDATDIGNGIPPASLRLLDAKSTTTGSLTSGSTSVPITVSSGAPAGGDVLVILDQNTPANSEEAVITGVSGSGPTYTLTVTRGFGGSTPQSHASGVYAYVVNTIHYGTATSADAGGGGCIAAGAPWATAYPSAQTACGYDVIATTVKAWLTANPPPTVTAPTLTGGTDGTLAQNVGQTPAATQTSLGTLQNPFGSLNAWHLNVPGTLLCGATQCSVNLLNAQTSFSVGGVPGAPNDASWLTAYTTSGNNYLNPQSVTGGATNVNLGNSNYPFSAADLAHVGFFNYVLSPDTNDFGSVGSSSRGFGQVYAGQFISKGSGAAISGCSATGLTSGGTAGQFSSGTTGTCTVTVTLSNGTSYVAPNHWACVAQDITTPADVIAQTAATDTTTQVTFSGMTVSGDVIRFHCMGF